MLDVDEVTRPVAERVEAGVAWLDEHYPRWYMDVDPFALDMADGERCLLGQLGRRRAAEAVLEHRQGNFLSGLSTYVCMTDMHSMSFYKPTRLGFSLVAVRDAERLFSELTSIWALKIIELQGRDLATSTP